MHFFTIHNTALSDKICRKLFLEECPIESCYVREDFQIRTLVKNAPGGRSWGRDYQELFTRKPIKLGW